MDAVFKFKPDGNVIESRVGDDVLRDSKTAVTSITSGKLSEIIWSSTLVP